MAWFEIMPLVSWLLGAMVRFFPRSNRRDMAMYVTEFRSVLLALGNDSRGSGCFESVVSTADTRSQDIGTRGANRATGGYTIEGRFSCARNPDRSSLHLVLLRLPVQLFGAGSEFLRSPDLFVVAGRVPVAEIVPFF